MVNKEPKEKLQKQLPTCHNCFGEFAKLLASQLHCLQRVLADFAGDFSIGCKLDTNAACAIWRLCWLDGHL